MVLCYDGACESTGASRIQIRTGNTGFTCKEIYSMKKIFRNRLLAVTAAAAASFLLLSGFDSALTVEEVVANMNAATAQMGGVNADVKGVADVSVDISAGGETQSLAATGSVDMKVQLTVDPLVIAVSGSMEGDASSLGMSSGSLEMEVYIAGQEDGSGITYVRAPIGGDTGWHAAALTAEDMATMSESIKAAFGGDPLAAGETLGMDLSSINEKLMANMTLAPEAVNVNGVDCYEIAQTVDGETFFSILNEVMKAMPQNAGIDESSLSAVQILLGGLKLDAVTDCSVEDFAPVYASVDLSGSDFSMIGQMFGAMMPTSEEGASAPQIDVNVNALNMTMNYEEVPAQIEIPAEALEAEVETTLSLNEAAQAVESVE